MTQTSIPRPQGPEPKPLAKAAAQAANRPTLLADEAHARITDDAFRPIEITASDDNPSVVGRMLLPEAAAWLLLRDLARTLGATVVTPGQQQDLAEVFRSTIAEADAQDNTPSATGTAAVMLNAHRDRMRDLRDTFRRAGVISG